MKMKKINLYSLSIAFSCLSICYYQHAFGIGERICSKTGTSITMSIEEAKAIANGSECTTKVGALENYYWCDADTGTWWIKLDNSKMKGCFPTCIVDIATGLVDINYMCTGALLPRKTK